MSVILFSAAAAGGPLAIATPVEATDGSLTSSTATGPEGLVLTVIIVDSESVTVATATTVVEVEPGIYSASFLAPKTPGMYSIVWQGPEPDQTVIEGLVVARGLVPSVDEVGALLRARTKVPGGAEIGTFRDDPAPPTRPSASQVQILIDEAVDEVTGKVGTPTEGTSLEGRVRRAAALYAAVLVELSFFPEQVASGRSPAETYRLLYNDRMKSLVSLVEQGGDEDGDGAVGTPEADMSFDTHWLDEDGVLRGISIVGFGTEW